MLRAKFRLGNAARRLFRTGPEVLEQRRLLAADTFWTVDSVNSFVTLNIPDQDVTFPSDTLAMKFRNQTGSTTAPWTTNTTQLAGQIATNFVDRSSLEFVGAESTLDALPSGNYRPNFATFNGTSYTDTTSAPGDIGVRLLTSLSTLAPGYAAVRDLEFDTSSAVLPITGTTFPAGDVTFSITNGVVGLDSTVLLVLFIQDSLMSLESLSALNAAATGSITSPSPYVRQLTLPLNVAMSISVGGTPLSATITGQIVATHELDTYPYVDPNGADEGEYAATWSGAPVSIVDTSETPSGATITDPEATEIVSLAVSLERAGGDFLGGDLLTADASGTSITVTPFDGTSLILSGIDTTANYQQVLRTIQYTNTLGIPGQNVVEYVTYTTLDSEGRTGVSGSTIQIQPASVTGRHIFYNQSSFDGASAAQNASDDNAIAPDKSAYLANNSLAVFDNVSSYSRGINGIMVDLAGPGLHTSINANDFVFKHGNNNSPNLWAAVTATPTISVRVGAGTGGSDRVTITWASNSIKNEWLEVQVLPTANTGLTAADVFFWGSKTGDVGAATPASQFLTSATDKTSVVNNQVGGVPITNTRDFNRDGNVTAADATTVIGNQGTIERLMINGGPFAPEGDGGGSGDSGVASALAATSTFVATKSSGSPSALVLDQRTDLQSVPRQSAFRQRQQQAWADTLRSRVFEDYEAFDPLSGVDEPVDLLAELAQVRGPRWQIAGI